MGLARKLRVVGVARSKADAAPIDTSPQAHHAKSVTALAWFFCCSKVSIGNYLNAGAPAKTKAGFNVQHWIAWIRARDVAAIKGDDEPGADADRRRTSMSGSYRKSLPPAAVSGRIMSWVDR